MSHEHWSNYWHSGVQTSLPQDFKANYDGAIHSYWQTIVRQLDDNAKVTDVCTGNGAVALILADIANSQNLSLAINAVDISQINTDSIRHNNPSAVTQMITFISDCAVEQLDQTVSLPQDLIVSQYGLEYSDLKQSAPAIVKSLKPGGYLVFIAHSPKSAVFNFMQQEEAIYAWLEQVGLLALFKKYAEKQVNAEKFKKTLLTLLSQHKPNPAFRGEPLFSSWLQIIARIRVMEASQLIRQRSSIKSFVEQHVFARQRANDMLQVAKKLSDDGWIKPLLTSGLSLRNKQALYYQNNHMVGDCYEFCLDSDI